MESIGTETVNGAIVYVIGRGEFENYLSTAYQLSEVDVRLLGSEVRLTVYHILDLGWRNQYGRIFQDSTMANTA